MPKAPGLTFRPAERRGRADGRAAAIARIKAKDTARARFDRITGKEYGKYGAGYRSGWNKIVDSFRRQKRKRVKNPCPELVGTAVENPPMPNYWRVIVAAADRFDAGSFRTLTAHPITRKPFAGGTRFVVGCATGTFDGRRCKIGMALQSVLIPRARCRSKEAAAKLAKRIMPRLGIRPATAPAKR